jgi:hypothetical protein
MAATVDDLLEGVETEHEGEQGGDESRLVRLLVGGRIRRRRLRRLLLAHILHDRMEDRGEEGEEGEEGGTDEERRLVRMLIGTSMMRRRRLRRLILAHLLRERFEERGGEEEEGGEEGEEAGTDEDRRLFRMLVGGKMIRRARLRRLLMAQLLRSRAEEKGIREYA